MAIEKAKDQLKIANVLKQFKKVQFDRDAQSNASYGQVPLVKRRPNDFDKLDSARNDGKSMVHYNQYHEDIRATVKKVDLNLLSQIHQGISVTQYLLEGLWIMQDVRNYLDQIQNGGYNNFIFEASSLEHGSDGRRHYAQGATKNEESGTQTTTEARVKKDEDSLANDVTSNAGFSMLSKNFATRREVEMRKLEQELLKINQRYEQVTDPIYLASLKAKLKEMEANNRQQTKNMATNEKEISLMDKKIVR